MDWPCFFFGLILGPVLLLGACALADECGENGRRRRVREAREAGVPCMECGEPGVWESTTAVPTLYRCAHHKPEPNYLGRGWARMDYPRRLAELRNRYRERDAEAEAQRVRMEARWKEAEFATARIREDLAEAKRVLYRAQYGGKRCRCGSPHLEVACEEYRCRACATGESPAWRYVGDRAPASCSSIGCGERAECCDGHFCWRHCSHGAWKSTAPLPDEYRCLQCGGTYVARCPCSGGSRRRESGR